MIQHGADRPLDKRPQSRKIPNGADLFLQAHAQDQKLLGFVLALVSSIPRPSAGRCAPDSGSLQTFGEGREHDSMKVIALCVNIAERESDEYREGLPDRELGHDRLRT